MSTSVSVVILGNTMRRFFLEHSFKTITTRYVRSNISFIMLHIHHVYGHRNTVSVFFIHITLKRSIVPTQQADSWGMGRGGGKRFHVGPCRHVLGRSNRDGQGCFDSGAEYDYTMVFSENDHSTSDFSNDDNLKFNLKFYSLLSTEVRILAIRRAEVHVHVHVYVTYYTL